MSPEKNPFLKPPSKPANKDTAGFIESLLGKKEGDRARNVMGDTTSQERKPAFEPNVIRLTEEEKARAKAYEKGYWTREQVTRWAESFGRDAVWVDGAFTFHKDGSITVPVDLILAGWRGFAELPQGIKSISGELDLYGTDVASLKGLESVSISGALTLCDTSITSLKGLESVSIGGNLDLRLIQATDMPLGVKVGGRIEVMEAQTALIDSLRENGYGDKLEII